MEKTEIGLALKIHIAQLYCNPTKYLTNHCRFPYLLPQGLVVTYSKWTMCKKLTLFKLFKLLFNAWQLHAMTRMKHILSLNFTISTKSLLPF